MVFTIKNKSDQAMDIGYLLHKNPENLHKKELSFGMSYVIYPEYNDKSITMMFLDDIDPIVLIRGKRGESKEAYPLNHYVNDRPYVCNSFTSVAISKSFGTAMSGICKEKPNLVKKKWHLTIEIPTLSIKGGEKFFRSLFEPLGYHIDLKEIPLDINNEQWGKSSYYSAILKGEQTIQDCLNHLYVFFPVLDKYKHYWVDEAEVGKLLEKGGAWLKSHPLKKTILKRYLLNLKSLTRTALETLLGDEEKTILELEEKNAERETLIEEKTSLNKVRMKAVIDKLMEHNIKSVLELGCGEGKLLKLLLKHKSIERISGVDVSKRELLKAKERIHYDKLPERVQNRLEFIIGSAIYRDDRFKDYDAITLVEVIEHIDENRLVHLERSVFEFASPKIVIVTTPNIEYNQVFENFPKNILRHGDHRFEWTRSEFQLWCQKISERYSYNLEFFPVGDYHNTFGPPTQMGVFKK